MYALTQSAVGSGVRLPRGVGWTQSSCRGRNRASHRRGGSRQSRALQSQHHRQRYGAVPSRRGRPVHAQHQTNLSATGRCRRQYDVYHRWMGTHSMWVHVAFIFSILSRFCSSLFGNNAHSCVLNAVTRARSNLVWQIFTCPGRMLEKNSDSASISEITHVDLAYSSYVYGRSLSSTSFLWFEVDTILLYAVSASLRRPRGTWFLSLKCVYNAKQANA